MSFPAKDAALLDRRLGREDLLVYGALCTLLDFREPRPAKRIWIARFLRLDRTNVRRSLQRLVACGYLDHAGREPGHRGRNLYRLQYTGASLPPQRIA